MESIIFRLIERVGSAAFHVVIFVYFAANLPIIDFNCCLWKT